MPPRRRPGGTKRMVFGALGVCFGGLPLMAGALVVVNAFSNAQQTTSNPEFRSVAWHNLAAEEIFPEGLGRGAAMMEEHQGSDTWMRQGIAEEASCEEVLAPDLVAALADSGCQNVLRGTYIDSAEKIAVTVALVVLERGEDVVYGVEWTDEHYLEVEPAVVPHPADDGPAAGFDEVAGTAVQGLRWDFDESPYVVAAVAGPIDGRPVNGLPEQWETTDGDERETFYGAAHHVAGEFNTTFTNSMDGK